MFLQRAAGHVWNAQRNMAALIGAGVLDRYPRLRLTALECGHGWLASWAARLDELAEMSRHALPPLARKPSEYIRGPQYFQSIQIYEGERSLLHAIESLGEDTLMFATDYPHSESWFPKSVEAVLGWRSSRRRCGASCSGTTPRAATLDSARGKYLLSSTRFDDLTRLSAILGNVIERGGAREHGPAQGRRARRSSAS